MKEKRGHFFVQFILSKGNFFKICVLSQCIVYWIHFRNIHTFTHKKHYFIHFCCLFLKLPKTFRVCLRCQNYIAELCLVAFFLICTLQNLMVKRDVESLFLIIFSWFCVLCSMVAICYTRNWFWLFGPTDSRCEEYCQKPKLFFVLVVSVDWRFGLEVLPRLYSN